SGALLQLSKAMTTVVETNQVLEEALRAVPSLLGCTRAVAYLRQSDGALKLVHHQGFSPRETLLIEGHEIPAERADRIAEGSVEALAGALEAVDEYTSNHARALAEMALAVGRKMELSEPVLKRLELAALFHDIGKIGVPSEIIRKAGPLTNEERRVMNLHPEI